MHQRQQAKVQQIQAQLINTNMQARELIESIASESKKDTDKIEMFEQQKEEILLKVDTDVRNMSVFLDQKRERKIKLQNEIQKIYE